ncbi:MAG: hypothetical protein PHU85_00830 [Phycisphaerae bacterium]|nr:hypothetical protein [Phycisphaerae bacterium]
MPGPAVSRDAVVVKAIERVRGVVRWRVGLLSVGGLLAGLTGSLWFLGMLLLAIPLVFAFLFILWVLQLAVIRWVTRWTAWSVWLVAAAIVGPIWMIGLLSLFFGLGPWFLIFGLGTVLIAGCSTVLRRWLGAWRDVRALTADEQARERAQ